MATTSGTTPLDRALDVLSHSHRRRVLTGLAGADAGAGEAFTPAQLRAEGADRERFRLELYHKHLPKLERAGYVDWDRQRGAVRRGPNYDEVAPLVELMTAHEAALPAEWP